MRFAQCSKSARPALSVSPTSLKLMRTSPAAFGMDLNTGFSALLSKSARAVDAVMSPRTRMWLPFAVITGSSPR